MEAKTIRGGWMLASVAEGHCPQCATIHGEDEPHNWASMYYQMKFMQDHGRFPTWADAMMHCEKGVRDAWIEQLMQHGFMVRFVFAAGVRDMWRHCLETMTYQGVEKGVHVYASSDEKLHAVLSKDGVPLQLTFQATGTTNKRTYAIAPELQETAVQDGEGGQDS